MLPLYFLSCYLTLFYILPHPLMLPLYFLSQLLMLHLCFLSRPL